MTDYASSVAAAEPSWTWWMTTAAAAAMRMRNLREHHHGGADDCGSYGDADDDDDVGYAGPDRKRPRCSARNEYWTSETEYRDWTEDGPRTNDTATVGPLDLSVKATVTTAAAAARVMDGRAVDGAGRKDRHAATTPVKRSTVANGRSSKKSTGKTTGNNSAGGGTTAAAVKAATRKLLPQLLQDHHRVDRSSPVSGTIIVPATPDHHRQDQSACRLTSPPSPYAAAAECADRQDDDYDGGDIDPEFNVVVATDEARRRLESIPNALGPYRCRLCSVQYVDAFALARHRCRCIVHVRYRCPECDKVFQCPANLASHRRWHGTGTKSSGGAVNNNTNNNNNNNKGATENGGGSHQLARGETTTNNHVDDESHGDEKVQMDGCGETTATTPAPAVTMNVTGFKKNILQRAVQAAAAAAAKHDSVGVIKNAS